MSALNLLRNSRSSEIKLYSSKHHLDTLLSYKKVIISPPLSTSGATGDTISTSGATVISQPTDYDVSRELDNFFANLFGAFDIFAHMINQIYLARPFSEDEVYFSRVRGAMVRDFLTDPLTDYLTSLQTKTWYRDLKDFRGCITHRNEIEFKITRVRLFMEASEETKILLPDTPFSYPPTYSLRREFGIFGVDIFKKTLNAIDDMYDIMEDRIRVANRIPV